MRLRFLFNVARQMSNYRSIAPLTNFIHEFDVAEGDRHTLLYLEEHQIVNEGQFWTALFPMCSV